MNFFLKNIPDRQEKPRENGLTSVMDLGLTIEETKNLVKSSGEYIDIAKMGIGSAYIMPNLKKKIKIYKSYGIKVHFGGTIFEAFLIRNQLDDFIKLTKKYKLDCVEIANGIINITHEEKCNYIKKISKITKVISEVGSKQQDDKLTSKDWVEQIKKELEAGSWKVTVEGRHSGNAGIYKKDGSSKEILIESIIKEIPQDKIIWEAPKSQQQTWFINKLGHNVNLGNITPQNIITLETMRMGLQAETFWNNLKN